MVSFYTTVSLGYNSSSQHSFCEDNKRRKVANLCTGFNTLYELGTDCRKVCHRRTSPLYKSAVSAQLRHAIVRSHITASSAAQVHFPSQPELLVHNSLLLGIRHRKLHWVSSGAVQLQCACCLSYHTSAKMMARGKIARSDGEATTLPSTTGRGACASPVVPVSLKTLSSGMSGGASLSTPSEGSLRGPPESTGGAPTTSPVLGSMGGATGGSGRSGLGSADGGSASGAAAVPFTGTAAVPFTGAAAVAFTGAAGVPSVPFTGAAAGSVVVAFVAPAVAGVDAAAATVAFAAPAAGAATGAAAGAAIGAATGTAIGAATGTAAGAATAGCVAAGAAMGTATGVAGASTTGAAGDVAGASTTGAAGGVAGESTTGAAGGVAAGTTGVAAAKSGSVAGTTGGVATATVGAAVTGTAPATTVPSPSDVRLRVGCAAKHGDWSFNAYALAAYLQTVQMIRTPWLGTL